MDDWFGGDFLNTNIHQHRASHLPALSLRGGGGQQYLAPKEFESMWKNCLVKIIIHQQRVCHLVLLASG